MDCSPPGSSVHGILQARILDWGAISFSRESSQPSDWTQVSRIAGRFFTIWATKEAQILYDFTYVWNLKKTNEQNRVIDTEKKTGGCQRWGVGVRKVRKEMDEED